MNYFKVFMPINKKNSGVVIIDFDDYLKYGKMKWSISNGGYVVCGEYVKGSGKKNQKTKHYQMHRLVTDCKKGMVVDHKDRNTLNNSKSNLRVCCYSKNGGNSGTFKKYKGVQMLPSGRYRAYITKDGKRTYGGVFSSEEDAAKKYNEMAVRLFGEFSLTNKVV